MTIRTENPEEQPLPDWNLLEMQWALQRIAGIADTGEWVKADADSESSVSSLEELGPLSVRGKLLLADESLHPLSGIYDWIPDPREVETFTPQRASEEGLGRVSQAQQAF